MKITIAADCCASRRLIVPAENSLVVKQKFKLDGGRVNMSNRIMHRHNSHYNRSLSMYRSLQQNSNVIRGHYNRTPNIIGNCFRAGWVITTGEKSLIDGHYNRSPLLILGHYNRRFSMYWSPQQKANG